MTEGNPVKLSVPKWDLPFSGPQPMLFSLPLPLPFHCNFWLTTGHPSFSGSGTVFWTSPSGSSFPTHDIQCVLTLHPSPFSVIISLCYVGLGHSLHQTERHHQGRDCVCYVA